MNHKYISNIALIKSCNLRGGARFTPLISIILTIILVIIAIIIIYIFVKFIYKFFFKHGSHHQDCSGSKGCLLLSEVKSGQKPFTIVNSNNPINSNGSGYSICIWLYVKADNFKDQIQKYKSILYRGTKKKHNSFEDNQYNVQPGVWLYGATNKILIRWNTVGSTRNNCDNQNTEDINEEEEISDKSMNPYINPPNKLCSGVKISRGILYNTSDKNIDNEMCIDNVPLDRWFHLGLVLHNQTVDIYVDGKLYSTLTLNSAPKEVENMEWELNKDNSPEYGNKNGFDGAMTQFRYFNSALSHYDILRIYSWGPYPFMPESLF